MWHLFNNTLPNTKIYFGEKDLQCHSEFVVICIQPSPGLWHFALCLPATHHSFPDWNGSGQAWKQLPVMLALARWGNPVLLSHCSRTHSRGLRMKSMFCQSVKPITLFNSNATPGSAHVAIMIPIVCNLVFLEVWINCQDGLESSVIFHCCSQAL